HCFGLDVVFHSPRHDLAPEDYLGQRAEIDLDAPLPFSLRGIVTRFHAETTEPTGVSRYRLHIAPTLWLLSQRLTSRIFQELSPSQMVAAIAAEHGELVDAPVVRLGREEIAREYTVQYGESDLDFVRRLLADHGISFVTGLGRAAVLSDALRSLAEAVPSLIFRPEAGLGASAPHVLEASFETVLAPSAAIVADYDQERPPVQLLGRAIDVDAMGAERRLGRDEFAVGKFDDEAGASRRAVDRLWGARSRREVARLRLSFPVVAGRVLRLVDHPKERHNGEWLVVGARSRVTPSGAQHEVQVIGVDAPHRPAPLPTPRVIGTQTAFVVGEPGREIDVDSQGRVCLRFHWDRRAKSHETTRRVRVSQGWAGPGYGFVCLPRVGDEVVVDFLDGDPDRPIVVGRVHNGVSPPPQQLEEQQAWSTWRSRSTPGGDGFNELTFDDAAGAERVYLHAQRDLIAEVENDAHVTVKGHVYGNVFGNGCGRVGGDLSLDLEGDVDVSISGNLKVDATDIAVHARGEMHLSSDGPRIDESPNHRIGTGGLIMEASAATYVVTPHFHVLSGNIVLDAGGSKIAISSGGIAIESSGPVTINGSVIKLNS
ncbi:MAG: type VI secretion system tip protein VgrG, partial [Myxococcales bacterium]|nr:type VI secretion system tip protein VgrG [Myxococcales bacterium]